MKWFLFGILLFLSLSQQNVSASSTKTTGAKNSFDQNVSSQTTAGQDQTVPPQSKEPQNTDPANWAGRITRFIEKMLEERGGGHKKSIWGYLILLLLFLGYLIGYRMGLVAEIIALAGIFVFVPMVEYVKTPVENFAKNQLGSEDLSLWISLTISFCILSIFSFVQLMLHKALSFMLKVMLLSPFNKLIGGLVGIITTSLILGVIIILLEEIGIQIPNDVMLGRELRFFAEKVLGREAIISWLQEI
ncbi:MAG: CvpA family protein [Cytophagales bacterium]